MALEVDAAMLLYLNPELQAYSNVLTVEDVRDRFGELSNLPSELPPLPKGFDDQVYLADNRDSLDVSSMNRVIREAMLNDGFDDGAIDRNSMYLGSIMRDVVLIGSNAFEFDADGLQGFRLGPKSLQVGDDVRLMRANGADNVYGRVLELDSNASPPRFAIGDVRIFGGGVPTLGQGGEAYTLYGIKLCDTERLVRVNLTRSYVSNDDPDDILVLDRDFNKELHQMLYPNTRLMTQSEAYVDYVNRWGLRDYRIANADDFYNASSPVTSLADMTVTGDLRLGKYIKWNGFTICNFSSNDWSTSDVATHHTLITDRAIKTYVDRPYRTTATFNRILACNDAAFTRNVLLASNVIVQPGSTTMLKDVTMYSNLTLGGYVTCATTAPARQLLASSRIGIGADGMWVGDSEDVGSMPGLPLPPPPTWNGVGHVSYSNSVVQVLDSVDFGPGAYTIKVFGDETALKFYPTVAPMSAPAYTVLDSNGNLGVGCTGDVASLDYRLQVEGDVFSTGMLITQSDARKKHDIAQVPTDAALTQLLQLRGCTYRKVASDSSSNGRRHVGLIAQDALRAVPEAVYTDGEGFHSIAYGNLVGLVVEALRGIDARLRALETPLSLP